MWLFEILLFALGVIVPFLISDRLLENYYNVEGEGEKTAMNRILIGVEIFLGERDSPSNGYHEVRQPIPTKNKLYSLGATLVCWLSVLYGLQFFVGISPDHPLLHILVYFSYLLVSIALLFGVYLFFIETPRGDLMMFPVALDFLHFLVITMLCLSFSFSGLFGLGFLQWSYDLFWSFFPILCLLSVGFLAIGGPKAYIAQRENSRSKTIANRLERLKSKKEMRALQCNDLEQQLRKEDVSVKFIEALMIQFMQPYEDLQKSIIESMRNGVIPNLNVINQTSSLIKIPNVTSILLNYWTPLDKPKRISDFSCWDEYLLVRCFKDAPSKGPKAHKQAILKLKKRIVNPIFDDHHPEYLLATSLARVERLVELWQQYGDYPEVVQRVSNGESEAFVLVDLGLFQD